jgi:hypothetical protein
MRSDDRTALRGQVMVEFALVSAVLVVALTLPVGVRSAAAWLFAVLKGATRAFTAWLALV